MWVGCASRCIRVEIHLAVVTFVLAILLLTHLLNHAEITIQILDVLRTRDMVMIIGGFGVFGARQVRLHTRLVVAS